MSSATKKVTFSLFFGRQTLLSTDVLARKLCKAEGRFSEMQLQQRALLSSVRVEARPPFLGTLFTDASTVEGTCYSVVPIFEISISWTDTIRHNDRCKHFTKRCEQTLSELFFVRNTVWKFQDFSVIQILCEINI